MFVLLKRKTHIACEKIVSKAMKRSLWDFWHPDEVVGCPIKVLLWIGRCAGKQQEMMCWMAPSEAGFSHPAPSLRGGGCYLRGKKPHGTPSEQENLCAWDLRSSPLLGQLCRGRTADRPSGRMGHQEGDRPRGSPVPPSPAAERLLSVTGLLGWAWRIDHQKLIRVADDVLSLS